MKRLLVFLMLATISICANVSAGAEQWATTYGDSNADRACRVQKTEDGGYIMAGSTSSFSAGDNDLWLLKFDSNNDISWQKTYGGSGNDYAVDIRQVQHQLGVSPGSTGAGGYIVVGTTYSFGAGESDIWVLRLDDDGNILWQRSYGGSSFDFGTCVRQIADGYIVAGNTYSYGAGECDIWILQLDGDGEIIQEKAYGGTGFDWSFHLQQTPDGQYLIAGDTFSFGAGENDFWVLKLDKAGEISWQKTYGGSSFDWAFRLQQTETGGSIIAGNTFSFGAGEDDIWILELDNQGEIAWQKTYGGASFDWPASIQTISGGGYVVTGGSYSFGAGEDDLWVFKLDSQGNVAWQKTYGGEKSDYATSIQPVDDGFVVIGSTSSSGAGNDDVLVLKLDLNGNIPDCHSILDCNAIVSDTQTIAAETNCCVESTTATITNTTEYGGGMENYYVNSSPTLTNCAFNENSGDMGGWIYNYESCSILTGCAFSGNSAEHGGGLFCDSNSTSVLTNCNIVDNQVISLGGAVYNWNDSSTTLTNCIVWNNNSGQIVDVAGGNAIVTYSDVQGGWSGQGNIDNDPLFADPANGDYHLKSRGGRWDPVSQSWVRDAVTSPCIDAGNSSTSFLLEPVPNGGRINMGAYGGTAEASKRP